MDPNNPEFTEFFEAQKILTEEAANTCEGLVSVNECEEALKCMESNKTPGTDGLTVGSSIGTFGISSELIW